ncbi:hypothetical protein BQ8794_220085 [Mesorhizobium prunaredense]|uniref:Uncharacterized protein n=1 Tax=Mesorhizobium prunaredense TaxID=1631249 RepID=A0A1R3V6M2_9HYPH|nr:hypothetical protein BQ8794_220085 [Mesorhizobium prunaredense]
MAICGSGAGRLVSAAEACPEMENAMKNPNTKCNRALRDSAMMIVLAQGDSDVLKEAQQGAY